MVRPYSRSGLTDCRLAHVPAMDKHLPVPGVSAALRYGYDPESAIEARSITGCFSGFLYSVNWNSFERNVAASVLFWFPDNISAVALTIGQRRTVHGLVGGYMLKVDAHHGIRSLFPASEGYFMACHLDGALEATCWALLHLFELRLQGYPLTLYHLDDSAMARCNALIGGRGSAASAIERMAARLLAATLQPKVVECVKGRFFDRVSRKLFQLATSDTNELVSMDLNAMAVALSAAQIGGEGRSPEGGRRREEEARSVVVQHGGPHPGSVKGSDRPVSDAFDPVRDRNRPR